MRGLVLLAITAFFASAHAFDLECERAISKTQSAYADIDLWPIMLAQTGIQDCAANAPIKFCVLRPQDTIADVDRVCGYPVNNRWECQTTERTDSAGNHIVQTSCPRWNEKATLTVTPKAIGTMTCYNGTTLQKKWRLGACHFGN